MIMIIIDLLVHDDDGRRAEARLRRHQSVKVHHHVVANPDLKMGKRSNSLCENEESGMSLIQQLEIQYD